MSIKDLFDREQCYKCAQGVHNRCYGSLLGVPDKEDVDCDCFCRHGEVFVTSGKDGTKETFSIQAVEIPPEVRNLLISNEFLLAVYTENLLDGGTKIYRKIGKNGRLKEAKDFQKAPRETT